MSDHMNVMKRPKPKNRKGDIETPYPVIVMRSPLTRARRSMHEQSALEFFAPGELGRAINCCTGARKGWIHAIHGARSNRMTQEAIDGTAADQSLRWRTMPSSFKAPRRSGLGLFFWCGFLAFVIEKCARRRPWAVDADASPF